MDATARWTLSDKHFQMVWSDWLRSVSRWRRFSIFFGLGLITVGIVVWAAGVPDNLRFLCIALILIGLFEVAWHLWDKKRWLELVGDAVSRGEEVSIHFTAEKVCSQGPTGTSEMTWEAFTRAVAGENGVFLWLQRGVHIYIPYHAIEPPGAAKDIVDRVNQRLDA